MIWQVTSQEPPDPSPTFQWLSVEYEVIKMTMFACEWSDFYQICQLVYKRHREIFGVVSARDLENEANVLFASGLLAWRFEDGLIVPAHPAEITAIFEEAKGLLEDPKYAAPNEQFRKANGHLAEKPVIFTLEVTPDEANSIEEAMLGFLRFG